MKLKALLVAALCLLALPAYAQRLELLPSGGSLSPNDLVAATRNGSTYGVMAMPIGSTSYGLAPPTYTYPSSYVLTVAGWAAPSGSSSGVSSFNTRTGGITLQASDVGSVVSVSPVTHQFLTGLNSAGAWTQAQPAFSDLSGAATGAQLPAPTTSTFGGILALASGTAHQVVQYVNASGQQVLAQLGFSDLTGTVSAAQLGTSFGNGQLLIGSTGTGLLSAGTLTAGSNVTITNGPGTITVAAASSPVSSFNSRTGAIVPVSGDYTVSQVTGAAPLASPTFTGTTTTGTLSATSIGVSGNVAPSAVNINGASAGPQQLTWIGSSNSQIALNFPTDASTPYEQTDFGNYTVIGTTSAGAVVTRYAAAQANGTGSTTNGGHVVGIKGEGIFNLTGGATLAKEIGIEAALSSVSSASGTLTDARSFNSLYYNTNSGVSTSILCHFCVDPFSTMAGTYGVVADFYSRAVTVGTSTVTGGYYSLRNDDATKAIATAGAVTIGSTAVPISSANLQIAPEGTTQPKLLFGGGGSVSNYAISLAGGRAMLNYDTSYTSGATAGALDITLGTLKGFEIHAGGTTGTPLSGGVSFSADASGNIGIGTSAPTTKLTVIGTTSATSFYAGSTPGVTCSGTPSGSFAVTNGIVTHC